MLARIVAMLTRTAMKFDSAAETRSEYTLWAAITSTSTAMLSTSTKKSQKQSDVRKALDRPLLTAVESTLQAR